MICCDIVEFQVMYKVLSDSIGEPKNLEIKT